MDTQTTTTPRFAMTYCSQCGGEQGPGDEGFSSCIQHQIARPSFVGKGATYRVWTDTHACTVIAVSRNGKVVTVQEDKATRIDTNGLSESQTYTYERDPNGTIHKFSLRAVGPWKLVGQSTRSPGGTLSIGTRRTYRDPSF
jgi:hypothetical protein